jgi:TolB protein
VLVILTLLGVGFFGQVSGGVARPSGGPDVGGKIAYVRNGAVWLYRDGNAERLTAEPKEGDIWRAAYPALSPDGINLVYTMYDEGFSDLMRMDLDYPDDAPFALTANRPRAETGGLGYTDQALWALHPSWSPDGSTLAFTTDIGTHYPGLYTINPNTSRRTQPARVNTRMLDFSAQTVERPTWSPDGTRIAVANYTGTRNGKGQIWSFNLETSRWTEVTNASDGAYDPAWSPDGAWIAFTMRQGNSHNIYVVPADAELWEDEFPTPVQITSNGNSRTPVWSPDGTRLAYLEMRNSSFDIYSAELQLDTRGNPQLGPVARLTENAGIDGSSGISWGP